MEAVVECRSRVFASDEFILRRRGASLSLHRRSMKRGGSLSEAPAILPERTSPGGGGLDRVNGDCDGARQRHLA